MIFPVDIPAPMLDRMEDYLAVRAIEIDGYPERATVADQGLSLLLCAGRKAIRDERRKKSKISKEPKALCYTDTTQETINRFLTSYKRKGD